MDDINICTKCSEEIGRIGVMMPTIEPTERNMCTRCALKNINLPKLPKGTTIKKIVLKDTKEVLEYKKLLTDISLCKSCFCMTHTVKGRCGKCREDKK